VVEDSIAYHIAHVAEEMREMGVKARWISVMAHTSRHSDWLLRGGSKDVVLDSPTNDTRKLLKEALQLFRSFYESGVPYKKAGVVVGNFIDNNVVQGDLFSEPEQTKDDTRVMDAVDMLNKRFGKETVTIGRSLAGKKWGSSKEFVSPAYTTNWDDILEIKA